MSQIVLLGDICDIKIGRTPPRKEEEWFSSKNGNKWVSIKDMGVADKNIYNTSEYLIDEAVKKFRIPLIKSGTLMLSFKLTVGRLCFAAEDMYSNEAIAQLPIVDSNLVDKDWLYYYLKNFNFGSLSSTSSIATAVNSQSIKNIKIDLPDLESQKKIADILSSLDEKIELNRKMNETLEQIGQSLFRHYFIDNPEASKWKKVKINDVVLINKRGFSPKYSDSGIPVINQRCVRNGTVVEEAIQYHDNTQKQAPNLAYLQSNDILINSMGVGTLGRVSQVYSSPREYIVHSCITILRANPDIIDPIILGYYMKYLEPSITQMGSGTTGQTSLNNNLLGNIEIILPDKKIQNFISTTMYSLVVRIDENYAQIQNLVTLRDALLPQLINGKVKL